MGKRGKAKKASLKLKIATASIMMPESVSSRENHSTRVHPSTDDCYPLNKLCRLCLLSNINMEPIFPYPGDNRLSDKIYQCTGLQIAENTGEGIPTTICGQCKKQLDQCHEFRLLCWKNNEVLYNLHAILSPRKRSNAMPMNSLEGRPNRTNSDSGTESNFNNPIVQIEKLDFPMARTTRKHVNNKPEINLQDICSTAAQARRSNAYKQNFGEISLDQLYTPSRHGRKTAINNPRFSKELVVCLTPVSTVLINKYKKKLSTPKKLSISAPIATQTKAAVKSFPQQLQLKKRGRSKDDDGSLIVSKAKAKATGKSNQRQSKVKSSNAPLKKQKVPNDKIAVPPKKRKENFESEATASITVICTLCGLIFSNQKNLSRHMATHENNRKQNRVFNCDVCKTEYLKSSQLTDHLRSPEHIENAGNSNALENSEISILPDITLQPDESEVSILPDNDEEQEIPPATHSPVQTQAESSQDSDAEARVTEITDLPATSEVEPNRQSPDTNDLSQQIGSTEVEQENVELNPPPSSVLPDRESSVNRDVSSVPVLNDIRWQDENVQYSDVCSTNNSENLFNGNGADLNSSRRVTFSDITEIVE